MQVKNKLNGNITSVPTNDNGIRALIRLGVLEVVGHEKGDMVQAQNGRVFPVMDPPAAPKWIVTTMSVGGADAQRVPARNWLDRARVLHARPSRRQKSLRQSRRAQGNPQAVRCGL